VRTLVSAYSAVAFHDVKYIFHPQVPVRWCLLPVHGIGFLQGAGDGLKKFLRIVPGGNVGKAIRVRCRPIGDEEHRDVRTLLSDKRQEIVPRIFGDGVAHDDTITVLILNVGWDPILLCTRERLLRSAGYVVDQLNRSTTRPAVFAQAILNVLVLMPSSGPPLAPWGECAHTQTRKGTALHTTNHRMGWIAYQDVITSIRCLAGERCTVRKMAAMSPFRDAADVLAFLRCQRVPPRRMLREVA
jgi:hypothetical protein